MRILYVAPLSPNDSAEYRLQALRRLGVEVQTLNSLEYGMKNPLLRKVEFRAVAGPEVARYNRDVLRLAAEFTPDVMWADKQLWMRPATLQELRRRGVLTASYMIDNFFGPRRDPGWRLYARDLPLYDLHVTQRDTNVRDYLAHGARHVLKVQTAFEPTVHFPPVAGWSDGDRTRDVSFIGTPYDERAEFLTRLWKEAGLNVEVNGGLVWRQALAAVGGEAIYRGNGELFREEYRETVWRSKINLSFLTHSNQDEFAHKSFEIAACGGFLLAERSQGHAERFVEDEEAVFFSDWDECVEKIRRYLPDAEARERIAAAGLRRAIDSGYSNDHQVAKIVAKLESLLAEAA